MQHKALLFPGQGSQTVGMGKDFFDTFSVARDVFLLADDYLHRNLSEVIFNGTTEELQQTTNSQVGLMLVSIAIFRVLQKECGLDISKFDFLVGHSLGEYSALTAAGSFSLEDTLRLLDVRAHSMSNCVKSGTGGMIAILGMNIETIESLCFGSIKIANDNCPGQVVVSGLIQDFEEFEKKIKDNGCRKFTRLKVSGPFHSEFMTPAISKISEVLSTVHKKNPVISIVSNVTANEESDIEIISDLLLRQMTSRVRFTESINHIYDKGVVKTLEIGSGKVLSGLVKRTCSGIETFNISSVSDIDILLKAGIF